MSIPTISSPELYTTIQVIWLTKEAKKLPKTPKKVESGLVYIIGHRVISHFYFSPPSVYPIFLVDFSHAWETRQYMSF